MPSILSEIRKNYSRVFRRIFVKRRDASSGLFESTWQDISIDVKNWGKIRREIDGVKYSKVKFSDVMVKMNNFSGRYNPNDDEASFWFGFAKQQRTLVKIEAGFIHQTLSSSGIYTNTEYPTTSSIFYGILSGDIFVSDDNDITLPIKPLTQIFRDFPAKNLVGFTSTGLTASQFVNILRDQTDGAGSFIFRPFLGDTTTFWDVTSTSNVYSNLNTSTAADVFKSDVWTIVEKLSESEDMVAFVKNSGILRFGDRTPATTASQFHFFGAGFRDNEYGHTIKKVNSFGKKHTDFYSRVEVKWVDSNTATAVRVKETAFTVTGSNDAWILGHRTFRFENFWIPTTTVADTILNNIYNNTTNVKDKLDFVSTFVPHLEILDRIRVSYDHSALTPTSRWDINDWAFDNTNLSTDLIWDQVSGDSIRLSNREFKILSIDLDLDKFETKINAIST